MSILRRFLLTELDQSVFLGPLNRGSEIVESKQILTTKSDKMQRAIYILSALKLAEAAAVEDHLEATAPEDEQALVQTEAATLA